MAAMLFDTLELARELREAGFSEAQAAGTAKALARGLSSDVATRSDLEVMKAELRGEIASLKSSTASWIITAVMVNTVAMIGIAASLYGLLRTSIATH